MAEFPYSEEDQTEQLKRWWKQNGTSIIGGVVLGLAIVGGYNYWQHYTQTRAEAASKLYERMMIDYSEGQADRAVAAGSKVVEEYQSTPYAAKAALYLARINFERKDVAEAERYLRWALENAADPATEHTSRIRLGRLLLDAGKHAEVGTLLTVTDYGGFESEYKELEGDLALAGNDAARARAAYERALDVLAKDSGYRPLLKAKLDHARTEEQS